MKPNVRYLPLEKAILAVVLSTCKLPHYFQSHTVVVLTQLPLKAILQSADYIGRIAKWGTILGAFDIKYMPRTSVKGQVLVDLVAEFTEPSMERNRQRTWMENWLAQSPNIAFRPGKYMLIGRQIRRVQGSD